MSSKNHNSPIVNGLSHPVAISNKLSSKFSETLNTHCQDMFVESDLLIHSSDVNTFVITEECVLKAFSNLKLKKSGSSNLDSNHFIKALPVITDFLSSLFTVLLRHGYLPACLKDCILVPVPKSGKEPNNVDNYRPIALASTISKALEWCILIQFEYCLRTSDFHFGFKPGLSTTLCTGLLKNVVSHYYNMALLCLHAFWMCLRLLTLSSIVYFFRCCLTEAYQTW